MFNYEILQKIFFLRILLIVVRKSRSFKAFRIINDVLYSIFRITCVVLILFNNNDE